MTQRIGKYELKRLLATGGMAEIWVASLTGPGGFTRDLAIKRILPHLARDEHFTRMFLDEASIASRLTHPNIAQIFELGEVDGEYFIAMELVNGLDLAQILDLCDQQEVYFPIEVAARVIADMLAALDFAHEFSENGKQLGVVHRDVSPHNVLVSSNGRVKLVDFGVAKAVERHSKTQTGVVKGKLSYMAPEQIEDGHVDRRADVFAAGVLLYELLTNRPPFGRELTAVSAILNKDPADPRDFRPEIPERLVQICLLALQKDPADRFQTAHAMTAEIEIFLRDEECHISSRGLKRWLAELRGEELPPDLSEEAVRPDFSKLAATLRPGSVAADPIPKVISDVREPSGEHFEGHSVASAFIVMFLIAVVVSGYLFRAEIGLTTPAADVVSEPPVVELANTPVELVEEGTAEWEAMAYDEESEIVFEEEIPALAPEDVAAGMRLRGEHQAADLLMWAWLERAAKPSILEESVNPVVAVLELPTEVAVEPKPKSKRKKKRSRKSTKKKPQKTKVVAKAPTKTPAKTTPKKVTKKPPKKKKKKKKGLERLDSLPTF